MLEGLGPESSLSELPGHHCPEDGKACRGRADSPEPGKLASISGFLAFQSPTH